MKLPLLYALAALLLAGCRHSDPTTGTTTVSGQVVEYTSRAGVPNASVQVYHGNPSGNYSRVGQPQPTDAQGRFAFAFEATDKHDYLLMASAPPGYVSEWVNAPSPTAGRNNEGIVIPTYAPAWVRLQLVDEPPTSKIVIHLSGYNGGGDRLYYPEDTTLVRPTTADSFRSIIWIITNEHGVDSQYSQDVNPAALDTVTVRIPF